jgi:hypothetical protein
MSFTKLSIQTTFAESIQHAIGPLALILSAAIGSRIGRWVFVASENAWSNAYIFGMVLGFVFFAVMIRKPIVVKTGSRQLQPLVFFFTIISSFLLCELFKRFHY